MDCVFCNIISGKVPADLIYQDDDVVAFSDINPKAKVHALIIPRKHISSVNTIDESDKEILGKLMLAAKAVAVQENISETGYRLVINTGEHAGQIVYHLHMHLLGGEKLGGVF